MQHASRIRRTILWFVLAGGIAMVCPGQDPLFDKSRLRDFHFTFKQAGWWNLVLATQTTKVPVKADLTVDGLTLRDVGVHVKGNTSARGSAVKKPFNVTLDAFVPGQRLHGYKTLNLNNATFDPTFTREVLTYDLMEKYLPTPQTAFARVYLNGRYWGCYILVEQPNKDFLRRYFRDEDGVRFKGDPPSGAALNSATLIYRGPNAASNRPFYELKSAHSTAWDELQNTIVKLNRGTAANLRKDVQSVIHVDRALWYFATCVVVHNMDSYLEGGHNYYMYFDPDTGLMNMIPWDCNMSFGNFFGGAGAWALDPMGWLGHAGRPLMSRLLAVGAWRQRYLAHIRTILDESYRWDQGMKVRNDRYQALIETAVRTDPNRIYPFSTFKDNVARDVNLGSILSVGLKPLVDRRGAFLRNHRAIQVATPQIRNVAYSPREPNVGQQIWIRASVAATGGMQAVHVFTATRPNAPFTKVQMFDDGQHRDGQAGDGIYGGSFAAAPAFGTTRFYVRGVASNLSVTFFPRRAEFEFLAARTVPRSRPTAVRLHELLADNGRGDVDEKGEREDWVELFNASGQVQDLSGMHLTDDLAERRKWAFPAGTTIAAGGYLRVWCDAEPGDGPLHTTFKLNKRGEELFLVDTDTNQNAVLDGVVFGQQSEDRSFGSVPDGDDRWFYIWTPSGGGPVTGTGVGRAVRFDRRPPGSPARVELATSSVPRVGQTLDLRVFGGAPSSGALLGVSLGVGTLDVGPLGVLLLDPATLVLAPLQLDASGAGRLTATLPVSLAGWKVFAQVAANELSNALVLRISR